MTTLARLSFQLRAEAIDSFKNAYERQLLPILKQHGLTAATEAARPAAAGFFSRFFAVESPAVVEQYKCALQRDTSWQQVLQDLAADYADGGTDDALSYHFGNYRTIAGPGERVAVGAGFRQGLWHSLGLKDGAPNNIQAILQDRQHGLWLATGLGGANGVSRFDGAVFTRFTRADGLAGNNVKSMLEDRRGQIWFATVEGVCRYDGHGFETFTCADGLGHEFALCLLEDARGQIWCGTAGGGVSYFDGESWGTFTTSDGLASNCVSVLLEDRQGQLWLGTGRGYVTIEHEGAGLSRFDGRHWTTFTQTDGLGSDTILSLAEDRQGRVWVGTFAGGVRYFDGEGFVAVEGIASERVMALAVDEQGHIWCTTHLNGVRRYDGRQWKAFTSADGLVNNQVTSLTVDWLGDLWFGSVSGVSRYEQGTFSHFTVADGLVHDGVVSILEDRQGNLWVGTFQGVCRYDGSTFTAPEQLREWNVWSMVEDRQGNLWFGDSWDKGVMHYDGDQFKRFTRADGLGDNSVWCMFEDRQGKLWLGSRTGGGVSCYDGRVWTTFATEDGLASSYVKCIIEDRQGHLWFGTAGGGASCFDGEHFTTFTCEDGLVDSSVHALLEDRQGVLWLGTAGGLSRYDGQTFQTLSAEERLGFDQVTALMEDRRGHLWLGTFGSGVIRYDGRVFQSLSRQDGLILDVVQTFWEDRNGNIWIGTEGGLTRYTPSTLPPQVELVHIIADRYFAPDGPVHIHTGSNLVTFVFRGCSWTTSPERMAFIYQLEGCDADWQTAYHGQAVYQDLPVGDYTFRIKAVDRDFNYSEEAEVKISIEPDALVESLTDALKQSGPGGEFVGHSPALKKVQQQLQQLAAVVLPVIILGETGTGKGLAARTLHELGPRQDRPFIPVNCGSIPEQLFESELFGHEKGAFTGATSRRMGKVELAKDGTLFLDEIGDMPLATQVKLLHLLEERTFERVGGTQVLEAQVRVVAATNRDLHLMVADGRFRQDLYFRLQVFEVRLPPLRERQEDIPLLALYFIGSMAAHLNKDVNRLSKAAEEVLLAHPWPGNVRELKNTIERAVVQCEGSTIQVEDLRLGDRPAPGGGVEQMTLKEMERQHIQAVLEKTNGVVAGPKGAAKILGLKEPTLRAKIKRLGIKRPS